MCAPMLQPKEVNSDLAERDWTDKTISASARKRRDRVLPDGVVLKLMKKSDWEGFKRFFSNMTFMALTTYAIHCLDIYSTISAISNVDDLRAVLLSDKMLAFIPLYIIYGFQMQCMAFAGGHELIHNNAFKTKWMNTICTFFVSTAFFEVSWNEKFNHKQHHIYTLDIDRDPELTSVYKRQELENLEFKSVPESRYSYFKSFLVVITYFQHRLCRLVSSSMGIMTDYTGTGYSMTSPRREEIDASVIREMQFWSALQLSTYIILAFTYGQTAEGIKNMLYWWMVPCLVGYGPINYFRNAEHADCDLVPNQLHNTRTVESNFIIRWLLWETNFHCEHHAYPAVPFYNLPKLHKLLDPHIKHNDCKSFTAQQLNMLKVGGWIDKQNS